MSAARLTTAPRGSRADLFDAWARAQTEANGRSSAPLGRSAIRAEARPANDGSVFDHTCFVERVCLWAPQPDLRVGGSACAEFGILSEPYAFAGTKAQQAIASRHGLRFDRLRQEGFHNAGTTPFLWTVADLERASALVLALLPGLPLRDLYGLAPAGQRLAVVERNEADRVLMRFVTELGNAGEVA